MQYKQGHDTLTEGESKRTMFCCSPCLTLFVFDNYFLDQCIFYMDMCVVKFDTHICIKNILLFSKEIPEEENI